MAYDSSSDSDEEESVKDNLSAQSPGSVEDRAEYKRQIEEALIRKQLADYESTCDLGEDEVGEHWNVPKHKINNSTTHDTPHRKQDIPQQPPSPHSPV